MKQEPISLALALALARFHFLPRVDLLPIPWLRSSVPRFAITA